MLSGTTGIIANITLFLLKLFTGIFTGTVAIIADAFNNISDAGSSVVTMLGFRMSSKHADKEHPLGHGRMEYITAFIVDIMIMIVGIELLKTAVDKIIHPELPQFRPITLILLGIAILIKLWLFLFYRKIGNTIDSAAIKAASLDSISDTAATSLVFISTLCTKFWDFPLDGWAALVVAVLILWAGFKAAKETVDLLLGTAPSQEFVESIYSFIKKYPDVIGTHDLMIHDYGPGRLIITLHAEISEECEFNHAHEVIDILEKDMQEHFGAIVTIHLDPIAINNEQVNRLKKLAEECMLEVDNSFTLHDFRIVNAESFTTLLFDLCIPVDSRYKDEEAAELVSAKIKERDSSFKTVIHPEHPFV
jgi:cation diffusion facilitator family transporter